MENINFNFYEVCIILFIFALISYAQSCMKGLFITKGVIEIIFL